MGIEVGVSKQRRSDIQIVSHQIGDATHQHELAIENYRTYQKGHTNGMFFFEFEKKTGVNQYRKRTSVPIPPLIAFRFPPAPTT